MSYSAGLINVSGDLTVDKVNSGIIKAAKLNFTNFETQNLNVSGSATVVTPLQSSNTTQIATTAFVTTKITNLLNGAPEILNTLGEIATSLNNNAS